MSKQHAELLQNIIYIIKTGNVNNKEKFCEFLELLYVEELDFLAASRILGIFLHEAIKKSSSFFVGLLMDFFVEKRSVINEVPIELWVMTAFNDQNIEFIMKSYGKDPVYYITMLINMNIDDMSTKILSCLMEKQCFKNINKNSWLECLSLTDDSLNVVYQNPELKKLIQNIINKLKMQKPKWIISNTENKKHDKIPNVLCTDDASDIIYQKFRHFFKFDQINDGVDAKKIIKYTYALSSYDDKMQMLGQKITNHIDDLEIFRSFGPVNTQSKYRSDEEICCLNYGGCRMFLCNDFSDYDAMDNNDDYKSCNDDWYTGLCTSCELHIPHKKWSLRLPLLCGGWKGCYCSKECLMNDANDDYTLAMISNIVTQIEIYCIYE